MAAPVHVLMLPSSAAAADNDRVEPELAQCMQENEGDYLDRRYQVLKRQGRTTGQDGAANKMSAENGGEKPGAAAYDGLWSGSSPLEIAIATCCDHEEAAAAASALSNGGNGGGSDTDSSSPMVESGSSDTSTDDGESGAGGQKLSGATHRCGAIGRGNEGRFAALIARHCHTAGDRALALAVLQRTMERDETISRQRGKKRKRGEEQVKVPPSGRVAKPEESTNQANAKPKAEGLSGADSDDGESDCHRMAIFLSAGGLKVLNQWLIDAFTPVPAAAAAAAAQPKEKGKRKKPSKEQEGTTGTTTTSPTGPILLPLLSILQSIPFNMELVMDSQINKQIKKLKKNLDRLVANFDEEESESDSGSSGSDDEGQSKAKRQKRTLEELTHPVSGGMPVVQVQKDVEKLMQAWKVAASDKSDKGTADFYGELRAKMEERFLALSRYESGEAEKPSWLERLDLPELKSLPQASSTGAVASTQEKKRAAAEGVAVSKKRQEELKRQSEVSRRLQQQQAELKAAQAARLEAREKMEQYRKRMMLREGSMLKKRKTETDSQEGLEKKAAPMRRVTWADQKTAGAKLVEVREFVRETEVYQSEEEEKRGQDSDDESDEKFEEDDFDDGDYDDETQASDSVDSDDFDGILNDDDANFSQEEEAGFTFETQELSKGKSGKGIQLNDDINTEEDGWETFTYDL